MPGSEQHFINLCKKQIELKFSFGNGDGYTQRDLEILSAHIAEKTEVVISLSTLKRLWKDDYKHSPQLATLNALAVVLDYKDWQSFKQANQRKIISNPLKWVVPASIAVIVISIAIWTSNFKPPSEPMKSDTAKKLRTPVRIAGPVHFNASKTVTSGIPNTVIFKYDVSRVVADSFYIQQSWNRYQRISINPKGNAVSSIYFESGFHRARLMANDSVIAMQPIHILSNGWEPHIYYDNSDPMPIDFKNENFIANGQLHLDSGLLAKRKVDYSKEFFSRISNSQVFDVHSDNFCLSTRMKVDSVLSQLCPWMDIIIVTDVHIFSVSLTKKGCEKYAGYKLGEISKGGAKNDLSALGCDLYNWQNLKVHVKDKRAAIYLNDKLTYEEVFKKDLGKIMGLVYIFDGSGSIDYVRLDDEKGKIVFEDDFER